MIEPSFGFIDGYALLIGVGNHRDKSLSLPSTANDAQELYDILTDPDRGRYPLERVTPLINSRSGINSASKARVLNGFRWLEERTTLNSTVIIYFSGHGMRITSSDPIKSGTAETYYLLPGDCNLTDLEKTGISIDELAVMLGLIAAQNMLLIFDCCHADGFKPKVADSLLPGLSIEAASPNIVYNKVYSQLRVSKGLAMMFSSKAGQSSWLMRDKQSSVFTHYLLGALQGEASDLYDTEVTVSRIFGYTSKKVPITVQALYGAQQIPQIVWEGEDFAVARIPKTTPLTFLNRFDTLDRVILAPISELSHDNFNLGDTSAANFPYIIFPIYSAYNTAIQTLQNINTGQEAAKRGILVVGGINSGKTRLAFEAMVKSLHGWLLLQWSSEYSISAVPRRSSLNGRDVVVFIDDLQKYVSAAQSSDTDQLLLDRAVQVLRETLYQTHNDFNTSTWSPSLISKKEIEILRALLKRVREAARRMVVVATCRIEDERHVRAGISELFDELRVIELPQFNSDPGSSEAEQIIQAFKKEGAEHGEDWDGTLGSLVLGLSRKRSLYENLVVRGDPAVVVLRSMKLLAQADILKQTVKRIQNVCIEVFSEKKLKERGTWQAAVELLTRMQFLREEIDASSKEPLLIVHKDTYFEKVVTDDLRPRFTQLQDVLVKLGDTAALVSLGKVQFFELERYQEALATFDQVLILNPLDTASWSGKVAALNMLGQQERALAVIDDALTLDPTDANMLLIKASVLNRIGRNKEALITIDHTLALNIKHYLIYRLQAKILKELKRYKKALVALDNALALTSETLESFDIWWDKALTLVEMKRYEEALVATEHALILNPHHIDVWGLKIGGLMKLERDREALDALDEMMAFELDHAGVWYFKGEAFLRLEHYEEALGAFDQSLTIDPKDANAWSGKGSALFGLERYEEALADFKQALTFTHDRPVVQFSIGRTLLRLKRYRESLEAFESILDLDPTDTEAWSRKGFVLMQMGQYEEALIALDRTLVLDFENPDVWVIKGNVLMKLERYEEALIAFKQALIFEPEHTAAWGGKEIALIELGRYEEAVAAFDSTLNPKYVLTWSGLIAELGQQENILTFLDYAVTSKPAQIYTWVFKGSTLFELGRMEEGLTALNQALSLTSEEEDFETWIFLKLLILSPTLHDESTY